MYPGFQADTTPPKWTGRERVCIQTINASLAGVRSPGTSNTNVSRLTLTSLDVSKWTLR